MAKELTAEQQRDFEAAAFRTLVEAIQAGASSKQFHRHGRFVTLHKA